MGAEDRSRLIATSSLAKAEMSLLRAKPATVAAVNPVSAAPPKTPQFDLARSASSLLFTLFVERAETAVESRAQKPAPLQPSDSAVDGDARRPPARTAALYSLTQAEVGEPAAPPRDAVVFSQQASVPPTIAQASLAAQSGLVAVLGQVSRGLDAKKIESFIKERPENQTSAQISDRNLLIMAVFGAATAAILLWVGILH